MAGKGQAGKVRAYSSAYHALETFENGKDFDPADMTVQKLEAFDKWLRTPRPKRKVLNATSIGIYMRCIRTIYNEMAVSDDYLQTNYPFSRKDSDRNYKIPVGVAATYLDIVNTPQKYKDFFGFNVPDAGIDAVNCLCGRAIQAACEADRMPSLKSPWTSRLLPAR